MVSVDFNSEDPGFDPLVGRGADFLSLRVDSFADLFVPKPSAYVRHASKISAHVKDPISICHTRVGLTAGGMVG